MKLQYMNIISHVADFHMMKVFITENLPKQTHVMKKLGRFGTVIPISSVWQACGKPSTKFPHG